MKPYKNLSLARAITGFVILLFLFDLYGGRANATDLTLTTGGRVTIELVSSGAAFSNTMSIISPAGIVNAESGCKFEASPQLTGLKILSEKRSQHGCRVTVDANSAIPGVQPFLAGTTLRFNLCSQENTDPNCEHVWSSDAPSNSDGFDHLRTTAIHPAEFPGRIFQLNWEDLTDGGDKDFDDLIAILRVDGDSDGDSLWDDWEQFGIDANGDGLVDLALGSNPKHKDIFVEIDFMDCRLPGSDCALGDMHNHRPKAAAITAVVTAFANAPVLNPDGSTGIALHVDISNAITHKDILYIPRLCREGGPDAGNFDVVKADPANFGPNNPRRFAYHYSLWAHKQPDGSSGCGEVPGNDLQVSLGGWNLGMGDIDGDGLPDAQVGDIPQQAVTFMHELGHNLNLNHGGAREDVLNRKPNYLSIMNYWFYEGIPPDRDGSGPLKGRIDYSRSALATLDEKNLNERVGIGDGTDQTFWRCPITVGGIGSGFGTDALDWNCDGDKRDTAVSTDLNFDSECVGPGTNLMLDTPAANDDIPLNQFIFDGPDRICDTTALTALDVQLASVGRLQPNSLTGFDDWSNLKYDLQSTDGFADGIRLPMPVTELDYETYLAIFAADLSITQIASPNPVLTGANITYTITVRNNRPGTARSVVVSDLLPAGTTFVSCAASGGGICAGVANMRIISFPAIPGGGSETIEIVAAVNCSLANGTMLANSAAVSSDPPDSDLSDNFATATATASNPPPVISNEVVSKSVLLPSNHKLVDVTVSYTVTDNCGPVTNVLSVSSNEPVNTVATDWEIIDSHHLRLRAERLGAGTGRVYTITITATDSAGNASSKHLFVTVPHDRRP